MISSTRLNAESSDKETRHTVLDMQGSELRWHPGDSVGVFANNCPDEVASILEALALDGDATVRSPSGQSSSLREVLTDVLCLQMVTPELMRTLAGSDDSSEAPLDDAHALTDWLAERHLADVVATHRGANRIVAQTLVDGLQPLPARLYSVASSQSVHPNELHLTIDTLRYDALGRARKGVASCWLADRVSAGDSVPLYLQANASFHIASPETDLILIGPGTGIAPFRGFLQDRSSTGATGRTWLFFGHRHQATDFLYGDELKAFQDEGVLEHLTCAWSRDQAEKIYV
jgi:sulfite reductase (NADPH) flavoprotein alpha-component